MSVRLAEFLTDCRNIRPYYRGVVIAGTSHCLLCILNLQKSIQNPCVDSIFLLLFLRQMAAVRKDVLIKESLSILIIRK